MGTLPRPCRTARLDGITTDTTLPPIVRVSMPPADGTTGHPIDAACETLQGRRWPDAGCSRIPNWVYTEPEIFAREQERIFEGPGWLYVCLEAEIAKPGNFK